MDSLSGAEISLHARPLSTEQADTRIYKIISERVCLCVRSFVYRQKSKMDSVKSELLEKNEKFLKCQFSNFFKYLKYALNV